MHAFEYQAPRTLGEAVAILDEHGSDATVLAGGQSLMILLRQGLVSPGILMSVKCVEGLADLQESQGRIRVGAAMTYARVSAEPKVRAIAPVLARAAGSVGSVHIRNLGTVGGSVCHVDPAGDVPTVLLVLDAEAEVASSAGTTAYPLSEFFTGMFQTRLAEDELLAAVTIPPQPAESSYGYQRLCYREGEYPLGVAACRLEWDNGVCVGARVAVGGGDVYPKRLPDFEGLLAGTQVEAAARTSAAEALPAMLHPVADVRGPAKWKSAVVADIVMRAVADAAQRREVIDA
jgi:aerobic carbon-monoxide dehydrogenase medium subunit